MRTGHSEYATGESELQARRGSFYEQHPGCRDLVKSSLPRTCKPMSAEFKAQVRRLHRTGERCLGELLLEILDRVDCKAWLHSRLDQYSRIDPALLDTLSARDFPTRAELTTLDGGNGRAAR